MKYNYGNEKSYDLCILKFVNYKDYNIIVKQLIVKLFKLL